MLKTESSAFRIFPANNENVDDFTVETIRVCPQHWNSDKTPWNQELMSY